jgi:DNA polymerase-3 subunit delta
MSSTAGTKLLRNAIKDRVFAPVYLFYGDEDFRKHDALTQLLGAAIDPSTRDFNVETLRGGEVDAQNLGSLLRTPPMMAERRAVVIRDVGALKKDARTALDAYLGAPESDVVLVLLAPAGGKVDKSLLDRTTAVEFEALTGEALAKWVTQQAESLGATITPEAIRLLINSVGGELTQLSVQLEKLANYSTAGPIDERAVAAIVGVERGETQSDLLRAIAHRDARKALELLPIILEQPKSNGVLLVMALGSQMLGLTFARGRRDRGVSAAALRGELFGFLKSGGSTYLGQSWGDAVDTWAAAVDKWTAPELERALRLLLATDRALKESRVSSDDQILLSVVLTLCSPARQRGAA